MTERSRYLPLSGRDRERTAGRNWSRATSGILLSLAAALDARPELATAPTLRAGVTVEQAVRELLTGLRLSRWQHLRRRVGAIESPSPRIAAIPTEGLGGALHDEAIARSAATARTSIRELGEVLIVALELRAAQGMSIEIDPFASGAVAADLALRAPRARKAVVRARTLIAVDGDWRVGTGPELPATAASIVLFLAGRGGVPPTVHLV